MAQIIAGSTWQVHTRQAPARKVTGIGQIDGRLPIKCCMQDRILDLSLRLTVVGLISVMGLATFIVGYQGIYLAIVGQFQQGAGRLAGAVALGMGTGLLLRYRGDLLDEKY